MTSIFQILEIFIFLSTPRKVSAVEFLIRQYSVEWSLTILLKRNSIIYIFVDIFLSFRCSNLKTLLWEHLWRILEEFCVAGYSSVLLERDFTRDHFFKFLEMRLSPQKLPVMDFYSVSNLQYFWEKSCS